MLIIVRYDRLRLTSETDHPTTKAARIGVLPEGAQSIVWGAPEHQLVDLQPYIVVVVFVFVDVPCFVVYVARRRVLSSSVAPCVVMCRRRHHVIVVIVIVVVVVVVMCYQVLSSSSSSLL